MGDSTDVLLRPARRDEARLLADTWVMSSVGILEAYLGNLRPGQPAGEVLQHMMALDGSPYSYKRCVVADVAGRYAGMANTYTHLEEKELTDLPLREMMALGPRGLVRLARRAWALGDFFGLYYDQKKLLGAMHADHLPDTLYLNAIGVDPAFQNRGVGALLLQHVLDEAKQRNLTTVSLHMWGDNHSAKRFYERHGFTQKSHMNPWLPPPLRFHTEGKLMMARPVMV